MLDCMGHHHKHEKQEAAEPSEPKKEQPPLTYFESPVNFTRRRKAAKIQKRISEIDEKHSKEQESFFVKHPELVARAWYIGHILIMLSSFVSILLCITRQVLKPWPRFFYRLTFVEIVATYTISLEHALGGARPGFFAMLPLQTFQLILSAAVSIVTVPHTIKLTPFILMSTLHVADTHSEHHSSIEWLRDLTNTLNDKVAPKASQINAYLDMWLFVELVWDCILIRPGAVIALGFYSFLFKVRMLYSPITQDAVHTVYKHIDDRIVQNKKTPLQVRNLWIRLRNKFGFEDLEDSDLYAKDTEDAIDKANLMGVLSF